MAKKILSLLVFLLLISNLNAQDAPKLIDSLKKELRRNHSEKEKLVIYSDLTWHYRNISIDSALVYGKKALSGAKKIGDEKLQAQILSDIGMVYFNNGNYDEAKRYYNSALELRKKLKDEEGVAKMYLKLANVHQYQYDTKKAMQLYLKGSEYFEKTKNQVVLYSIKSNIASLYYDMKNFKKAIEYYNDVVKFNEENEQHLELSTNLLNLAGIYHQMNDTVKAVKIYNKSLKYCQLAGHQLTMAKVYNNLGEILSQNNYPKKALAHFNKALEIRKALHSDVEIASINVSIAIEYLKLGKLAEADKLLHESLDFFTKNNNPDKLVQTYLVMITNFAYSKQPDSVIVYADKYALLKDKILQEGILKQSTELETKYQTEKKEKLLLQKEAEAKERNNIIILLSIIAFFTAIAGYLFFRQQRLKNKQQEQEFLLKSAISKIETQNKLQDQRLEISKDLHDNIGAQLTFIISSVDNIKRAYAIENPAIKNRLENISGFTKSTIQELRDTIWAMNSSEITFEDLQARIMNFIEKAQEAKSDIRFEFSVDPDLESIGLSSISGMNIYRTIQEALNNSIKHAAASFIQIKVENRGEEIQILISDDGKGFEIENTEKGNGFHNMKKRIESINGEFSLVSSLSGGTEIFISIDKNKLL